MLLYFSWRGSKRHCIMLAVGPPAHLSGWGATVALFEFSTAATGAGGIAVDSSERARVARQHRRGAARLHHGHDLIGIFALVEQPRHGLHCRLNMVEETFVAGAEIIESRFPVGRLDEAIARAPSVTGVAHLTLLAVAG